MTTNNTATAGHNSDAASDAVSAIETMFDISKKEGNAQGKLLVYMFNSEITFSKAMVARLMEMKASPKVEKIDEILCDLSPLYSKNHEYLTTFTEKKKADPKSVNFQLYQTLHKGRAATRAMFIRALTSLYGLQSGAKVEKLSLAKSGAIKVGAKDEDGDLVFREASGQELFREGDKIAKENGAKASRKDKPSGASISPAQLLKSGIDQAVAALVTAKEPITDYNDGVAESFQTLLITVLRKQFEAEGTIDLADVTEFLSGMKDVKVAGLKRKAS